ncbi:hypothetical protein HAX54_004429 [Datura stramonium]|uniref:Uncharacterized protein n=1 Tax=Datura stramonium TaxID=4076 RepID=A0ABS8T9A2_DATST|nr:hypothetical protein [Datura stramonium]
MDQELMRKDGYKKAHKFVAEDEVNIHNLIFRDSAREELYSFFEASTKVLNGQRSIDFVSPSTHWCFHPLKVFSVRAEEFEEKMAHGCYKEGPFNQKDFVKRKHQFTKKERSILNNGVAKQLQIPNRRGDPRFALDENIQTYRIELAKLWKWWLNNKLIYGKARFTEWIKFTTAFFQVFRRFGEACFSSASTRPFETGQKPDCKLYYSYINLCKSWKSLNTMFGFS